MATTILNMQAVNGFVRDRRGVSAVEFALLAPLMVGLYLGCVEISEGVAASRKVSLIAGTLANLTSQVQTISASDMTNILDASTAIVSPYDASKLKITLSCMNIDASKNVTVKWSATRNGGVGGTVTVPTNLQVASSQLLLAQVTYAYTPTIAYTITGTLTLSDRMYMAPRITAPTYGTLTCP